MVPWESILTIAQEIYKQVDSVTDNQEEFQQLVARVKSLLRLIEKQHIPNSDGQSARNQIELEHSAHLHDTLKEVLRMLSNFQQGGLFSKFIKARQWQGLFARMNRRLDIDVQYFGVEVETIHSMQQAAYCSAIAEDLSALKTAASSLIESADFTQEKAIATLDILEFSKGALVELEQSQHQLNVDHGLIRRQLDALTQVIQKVESQLDPLVRSVIAKESSADEQARPRFTFELRVSGESGERAKVGGNVEVSFAKFARHVRMPLEAVKDMASEQRRALLMEAGEFCGKLPELKELADQFDVLDVEVKLSDRVDISGDLKTEAVGILSRVDYYQSTQTQVTNPARTAVGILPPQERDQRGGAAAASQGGATSAAPFPHSRSTLI